MRGYLSRPPVAFGAYLPPPPPPHIPVSFGDVFPTPLTRTKWYDLCDEEESGRGTPQKVRPPGVVSFLVDAPMPAKDTSRPTAICLFLRVGPKSAESPSVSPEPKEFTYTDVFLERPSTNGIIMDQPSINGGNDCVVTAIEDNAIEEVADEPLYQNVLSLDGFL